MSAPEVVVESNVPKRQVQHEIWDSTTAKTFKVVKGQIPDELIAGLTCDFSEEEIESIYARVNKTLAPSQTKPQALWVFGPSAVGKSFLGGVKSADLFGNVQNAVVIDGAEFRELHAGFQAVCASS